MVMLALAGLALREAARVDSSVAEVVSMAPASEDVDVRTADRDLVVPAPTTTTTVPPVPTTGNAPAEGAISLQELASQAMEEAARNTTTTAKRVVAAAPRPVAATTATTVKKTTTTTRPKATTTTSTTLKSKSAADTAKAAAPPPGRSQAGVASWFNAPDRSCAHNVIPRGTLVKVTRLSTGASTTCTIDQGGPADQTRIIDLSMDTFAILADPSVGLIEVRIEW